MFLFLHLMIVSCAQSFILVVNGYVVCLVFDKNLGHLYNYLPFLDFCFKYVISRILIIMFC